MQTKRDDDDDDGLRRIYVKGQMVGLSRKRCGKPACAVEDGLDVGATLTVVYTGDGEPKTG